MAKPSAVVISIGGVPGSGKSTLAKNLASRVHGSVILRYDDYSKFLTVNLSNNRRLYMSEAAKQSMMGGFWDNKKVAADLRRLKTGKPVYNEFTRMKVDPQPLIIFDCMLGRGLPLFADIIDYAIVLDNPLEIALARRLLQICRSPRSLADPENMRKQYIEVLQAYLHGGIRTSFVRLRGNAMMSVDLVLDGMLTTDKQVEHSSLDLLYDTFCNRCQ